MSASDEHLATRRAAGLFDFSFMGLYEFPDLASVQPHQSRDLRALSAGQIAYTLILAPDGSVFNDATVWRLPDGSFWLFTGRRSDFARFKSDARDRSGEFAVLALQGPASGRILARLVGVEAVRDLRYFHFLETANMIIGRLGYSGELGYELLVPPAEAPGLRRTLVENHGVPECGWDAANSLRIEAGYVLFDREIDGRANPSELGLERLVDDKAMEFPLTRKLAGLEILDRSPGAAHSLAHVTSECFSPTVGKRIGLGFCPPDAVRGDLVRLSGGGSARVATRTFYDPERRRPRAAPL